MLGAVTAVMGSMAALEAVKVLTGYGEPLKNKMLMFDGKTSSFRTIKIRRNPNCPLCGQIHK